MSLHPLSNQRHAFIILQCRELSKRAMSEVLGRQPYPWQEEVLCHLAMMKVPASGLSPGPVL